MIASVDGARSPSAPRPMPVAEACHDRASRASGGRVRPIRVLELRSVRGTGGGPEKTILRGAARADPRRFEVTVCYVRDDRDSVFHINERAAVLGVDYVEVRERHSLDPAVWPALRRLVRSRGIDIVHAHDYKTDLLALGLRWSEGVTPLATVHGWFGTSWREAFYYAVDKRLIAAFPRAVAVSEPIRDALVAAGARRDRVSVILNGIDHRAFRRDLARRDAIRSSLGVGLRDVVIGSVGRLAKQKRFDLLMDAVVQLRDRHPDLRLLIAGEGELRSELDAHARRVGLDPGVLLGQRGDVVDLHHAFDLFVQSSDDEGTANTVLEAMALETPIVATSVGGTAAMVRDGVDGLLVEAGDATRLAGAIDEALDRPAARAERTRSARSRVEGPLSFDARMDAVEAIYEELATSRNARRRR